MGILRTDKISGLETPTAVTGSVSFDGTDDALIIADHGDTFDFLNSDFTVECWIYPRGGGSSNFGGIWSKGQSYQLWWKEDTERIEVYASSDGSNYNILNAVNSGSGSVPANQWSHIAHTREGDTFRIFVNGTLTSSATSSSTIFANTNAARISDYDPDTGTYELDGEISNLRVLKGTALYTANFTPPTHALEVIKDTVILCCNNPDSVTASAFAGIGTAYAITTAGNPTVATRDPGLTRDFTGGTEFRGVTTFDTQGYFVPPSGTTTERFPNFGAVDATSARGLFGGGRTPSYLNTIDYVTISTTGNAQDFGDLTQARGYMASSSSRTRGVFNGGGVPSAVNTQDFITISSTGDASDFGELQTARYGIGNCSSSIRGVLGGGNNPSTSNVIEFITIATDGNTQDFGDLTQARVYVSGCSSSTRGVFGGGTTPSDKVDTMDFITISSTGNATDFGNLTQARTGVSGLSSRTRGVFSGGLSGNDPYTYHDIIDYITIAALGNATDFGDLIEGVYYTSSCSSSTRGVIGGGKDAPAYKNTIQYVTIASTGDAQDFGDLTATRGVASAVSNGHGGLG